MVKTAGPPGHWLLGHLRHFRNDRLGFFTAAAREFGDVVPMRLPGKRLVLISRPDLIEQVLVTQSKRFIKHFGLQMYRPVLGNGLVTSEGDFWRRQRKLSAPAFQGSQMGRYVTDMVASTDRFCVNWATAPATQDVHHDMMQLTLEIACRTLFGADACPDPAIVGQSMHDALQSIDDRFSRIIPVPDWFPNRSNRRLRGAMRTLDDVVKGIIDRQRATPHDASSDSSLLTMLLRARDDDGSAMSAAQLLDEVRTIFLAGHETTALALAYVILLLAQHADVQERLADELASVLAGRLPALNDLANLPFTRNVVTEAMRLYPPVDVLGREATEDVDLGDGVHLSKGTNVFMSQWVMHRDPRFFNEPTAFKPDRWTPAFEKALPKFAYFPFGGGPRYCVGQSFAIAEAVAVLATLCQRFRFASDPTFALEFWPSITLRPRDGVRVNVAQRASH